MIAAPVDQAGPARRMAVGGVLAEIAADQRMEAAMGLTAEPLHQGKAGSYMRIAKVLNIIGTAGTVLLGRRSRTASVISGAALMAGSIYTRFGIFEAGQQSARDPKYTVAPKATTVKTTARKSRTADPNRPTPSNPEQKPSTTRSEDRHENRGAEEQHV